MNPPTRLPAAAPGRVRDRLAQAADGPLRVVHHGPHSVYLDLDGCCVGVVDAVAAKVPCALRVLTLDGITGERAEISGGVLRLDGVPVSIGRIVDVTVPALGLGDLDTPPPSRSGRSTTGRSGRRAASAGERVETPQPWVAELIGAGEGLTPYGDDVLCGWLAIHRAAGVDTPAVDAAVRALSHRTTLLSATLLDCALQGEVLPEFATWVSALGTPSEPAARSALEAVGHTSGRGLLAGARRGLHELAGAVAA